MKFIIQYKNNIWHWSYVETQIYEFLALLFVGMIVLGDNSANTAL